MSVLSDKYLSKFQALLRFPNLFGSPGIYRILKTNFEDLRQVTEEGRPYAAISVFVPSEILAALQIHYLPLEPVIATASQFGVVTEWEELYDDLLVTDTCCCGGQSLLALYERQVLPLPKYFLSCSHMCDDSLKTFNFLARRYDVPIFNLDVPYQKDREAVAYLASQLRELVRFICSIEHKELAPAALEGAIAVSNRTNGHRQALFSSMKTNPPLFRMFDNLPTYPMFSKFGRPEVETIYRELAEEVQTRVAKRQWAFEDGCYRLLWLGMIPLTFPKLLGFLDTLKFGFPITELALHSDFGSIEGEPFEGIALKILNYPLVGPAQRRLDKIAQVLEEYGIEGVIHFNHRGCVSFNGDNFLVSELLKSRNVPLLVLEGDIALKKYCAPERLKEALEGFRLVLEERHGKR